MSIQSRQIWQITLSSEVKLKKINNCLSHSGSMAVYAPFLTFLCIKKSANPFISNSLLSDKCLFLHLSYVHECSHMMSEQCANSMPAYLNYLERVVYPLINSN